MPDSRGEDKEGEQLASRKGPLERKVAWGCCQKDNEVRLVERGVEDKLFRHRSHFTLGSKMGHGLGLSRHGTSACPERAETPTYGRGKIRLRNFLESLFKKETF